MAEYAIEVSGLTKKFKKVIALDGFNMNVKLKSLHGLLGPNGAGKTTTIKCILGMLLPDSGEVRVLGHPVRGDLSWSVKSRIGYVPEYPRLFAYLDTGVIWETMVVLKGFNYGFFFIYS